MNYTDLKFLCTIRKPDGTERVAYCKSEGRAASEDLTLGNESVKFDSQERVFTFRYESVSDFVSNRDKIIFQGVEYSITGILDKTGDKRFLTVYGDGGAFQ